MRVDLRNGGLVIGTLDDSKDVNRDAVLSLVYAEGQRPDVDAIVRLQARQANAAVFTISHCPAASEGWVELLAQGLTFDCTGLAPARAAAKPATGTLFGLDAEPLGDSVALAPGPHLVQGGGLLPVLRVLAKIGLALTELQGLVAVSWNPAASWMSPDYFRKVISGWLDGGAFPALGLTTLREDNFGAVLSQGLGLLIGQEVRFEPGTGLDKAQMARIAVRLIHELTERGPIEESTELAGPNGERLLVAPIRNGTQLRVMVHSYQA